MRKEHSSEVLSTPSEVMELKEMARYVLPQEDNIANCKMGWGCAQPFHKDTKDDHLKDCARKGGSLTVSGGQNMC